MTNEELLSMLKINLEIATSNEGRNTYLTHLIEVSKLEIAREGIELTDSIDDSNIVIMYAAYLYRKRAVNDTDNTYITSGHAAKGMPRMLRYALNNRLLSQKMRIET